MKTSKHFSKVLAVILCVVMLMQMMPLAAFADETTPENPTGETTETTPEDYGVNPAAEGEDPVTAVYTVEHYLQAEDGSYAIDAAATETKTGEVGADTAAEAKTYEGYTAQTIIQGTVNADGSTVVKVYYNVAAPAAPTTAQYTVEHYLQAADGTYTIDAAATETKTGEVGADTVAIAKSYEGYTAQTIIQGTIAADGSTVVKVYYNVAAPAAPTTAQYTVEHYLQAADGTYTIDAAATETKTGEVGADAVATAKSYEGYTAQTITQGTINADGSTVVKVYYSKNADETDETIDVDAMSDEELLDYIGELSDEELAAFEASLTEAQYQRVSALLGIEGYENEQINTFKFETSTLAPGVTQSINQGYAADGALIKYYVAIADINREDVGVQASYMGAQCTVEGMASMTDQSVSMTEKHSNPEDTANYIPYYTIVAGVNGDGYDTSSGKPSGVHIMNGEVGFKTQKAGGSSWFAIFEDGTALCGSDNTDWDAAVAAHGPAKEAIGGFQLVRKNGVDYAPGAAGSGGTYLSSSRYPRSFVGVTGDNKVVLMAVDGNNAGGSAGTNYEESLELMDELGCTYILCLDGGGSATYISRPEGANNIQVTNVPSDGGEREVSNGLVIYTSTPPSDTFDHAAITVESEYVAPGASTKVSAIGVSPAGTSAEIPEGVVWESDLGTVADGVFTAGESAGTGKISMMLDGREVGSVTVNVVHPDALNFKSSSITIPYGKTVTIEVIANYGLNEVAVLDEHITLSVSDAGLGTVSSKEFTADDGTSGVTSGVLTATYSATNLTGTAALVLGRGSEIVEDFEDNFTTMKAVPVYDVGETASSEIVTAENGQVRSGKYALAIHADYQDYAAETYTGRGGVKLIDMQSNNMSGIKDAVAVGFWIYFPEDFNAVTATFRMFKAGTTGKDNRSNLEVFKVGVPTSAEKPGWYYMSVPADKVLSNENGFDIGELHFYIQDYIDEIGFDKDEHMSVAGKYTFYVDDFTIDYSTAVEDRENPVFADMTYAVSGMSDAASLNGNTIRTNTVDVIAKVADFQADNMTGLDYATAEAIIDGVDVTNSLLSVSDGYLTLSGINLAEGTHTIRFNICDKSGNPATIERYITVDTADKTPAVIIAMKDPNADRLLAGSVHYIDIKADNMAEIAKLSMVLNMNGVNDWCLDEMVVSKGFDVVKSQNAITNDVTLTFTRNSIPVSAEENLLASIPVRIWYTNKSIVKSQWVRHLELSTDYGVITTADGNRATFAMAPIEIDTEVYVSGEVSMSIIQKLDSHKHKAGTATSKAATCTENGYTDAVFCVGCACKTKDGCKHASTGCGSVLDWGTTIPATGHTFVITDDVLKCACGMTFTGIWTDGKEYTDGIAQADGWVGDSYYKDGQKVTGIQIIDGYYYDFGENGVCENQTKLTGLFYDETVSAYRYAKMGKLLGGWVKIDDYWHYFKSYTKVATVGEYTVNGITYQFDETGKTEGTWHTDSIGTRYYCGGQYHKASNPDYEYFVEIDGKKYNFDYEGYVTKGIWALRPAAFVKKKNVFEFGEDGVLIRQITEQGPVKSDDGFAYYINEDGYAPMDAGLVQYGEDYYYVLPSGKIVTDSVREISEEKANGLLPAGWYTFDADGKMEIPEEDTVKNGIVNEDGVNYYYIDGILQKNLGLIKVDGDYYYVCYSGKLKQSGYQTLTAAHVANYPDISAGIYYFGTDSKMEIPEQDTAKDGIYEEDGIKVYYVNGVKQKNLGLIQVDGDYYFVCYSGKLKQSGYQTLTAAHVANYPDISAGIYYFGTDSKMEIPEENTAKNGIYEEDGIKVYYVNGVKQKNLGLIKVDGDYYFVCYSGKLKQSGYQTLTAAHVANYPEVSAGVHYFGTDCKMVIK